MEDTTIVVDLAKSVCQVAISDRAGRIDVEKRFSRERFLPYLAQQPPATVLLEACGSAHDWARQIQACGHGVRLLPAPDGHRYVRRNKTDRADTKALLETGRNDEIHAVPIKTIEQQAVASRHRVRSSWLATRTSRLNTIRGVLREFGVFIPVGAQRVVPRCERCWPKISCRPPCTQPLRRPVMKSKPSNDTCAPSNDSLLRSRDRCLT